tara:strand:- start:1214 stop:1660 length:447 start_codon:yes stop_codon:yes gene_type:complete
MGRKKIYDSRHQQNTIYQWKARGLLCREGETYKDIYYHVMSINNCELCNVEFSKESKNLKCMDHDHETGYFRKVLCNPCNCTYLKQTQRVSKNSKTGILWINIYNKINKDSSVRIFYRYKREGFKVKTSQSLTKLIALSFINILKEPI